MRTIFLLILTFFLIISCKNDTKHSKIKSKKNDEVAVDKPKKEVFGFHTHWMENYIESYDLQVLSAICYYNYELNPYTGDCTNPKNSDSSKLIDAAKANNVNIYLTVTNFSEKKNEVFLRNEAAQEASIQTIIKLLNDNNAHGVTINFEDVPSQLREDFTGYIKRLSSWLSRYDKKVVIILPAVEKSNAFDLLELNKYVEYYIAMDFDYHGPQSSVAGPVAPLYGEKLWTQGSVVSSINQFLEKGIPKDKLILMVHYSGNMWETEDAQIPSKTRKFIKSLWYSKIKNTHGQKVLWDSESQTSYLNFKNDDRFIQIWFEDAKSLEKKYDYVVKNDLAGVSIWALGYDAGHDELWNLLKTKFKNN